MTNALIRKLDQFARLSNDDRQILSRMASERVRRFSPREDIIREGDKPTAVYLVIDGWACRYKYLEDGRRQIIAFFLPGDMCDLNIYVLREMDHSIGTITDVSVAEISREGFDTIVLGYPRITQAFWWETLVSAAIQREWTVNLGQRNAFERLAHLFCELFFRLRSAGLATGNTCDMPITQTELADTTGLSPVHVNRTLQELRAASLIVLNNKTLTILDLPGLMSAGLFNPNYLHLARDGDHLDAND